MNLGLVFTNGVTIITKSAMDIPEIPSILQAVRIVGDGNCLYRAFSHYLYGHQDDHLRLRQECMNLITENQDEFHDIISSSEFTTLAAFIDHHGYVGDWTSGILGTFGEEFAVYCLAVKYQTVISVFLKCIRGDGSHYFRKTTATPANGVTGGVCSLKLSGNHYDLLLMNEGCNFLSPIIY